MKTIEWQGSLKTKAKVGEEIIFRHDVTIGFFRKKTIGAYLITNYRVMSPEGTGLWLNEIDDVVSINQQRQARGGFNAFGTRGAFNLSVESTC